MARKLGIVLVGLLFIAQAVHAAERAGFDPVLALEPVQSSRFEAARFATDRLLDRDPELMDAGARPKIVLVKESGFLAEGSAEVDAVARDIASLLFQRDLQVTIVETSDGSFDRGSKTRPEAETTWPETTWPETTWFVSVDREDPRWILRVRAQSASAGSLVVPYENKPWVTNLDAWPAEPGGIVIRGESGLRGDAAMARDAALRDAAAQLYDTLEGDPRRERSPIASWSRERARERLAKALANPVTSGSYVRDWYVAESGRALGTVYRAHALLSVPRDEFEAWGNRLGDWAAGTERRVWALLALCVLAIPLTFIAYLKLDATTRGCCSFGLRIGALAIVALVFLASWASVT